uniref:PH domain-containing protein n=3 Tax=Ascaris TaxID=6251 RepID=F1KTB7_ASCSU
MTEVSVDQQLKSKERAATMSNKKEKKGVLRSLSFQFSSSLLRGKQKVSDVIRGSYDVPTVQRTHPEISICDSTQGVQCHGILLKQHKRRNRSARWNKRFFILKECFLLYYKVSIKKLFEKTRRIDLHPKGIIPLVGCSIVAGQDHGHKFCLLITHTQFKAAIIVCASDSKAQEMWLKALREATKISYKNTIAWEKLVEELESHGSTLTEEKKNYEEKLLAEAHAREEEHNRYLSLAKAKEDLEKERERLIRLTKKLKDDLQSVKNELKLTNETKRTLEQEKISLNAKTEHLVSNMESLNLEKSKIEEQMSSIIKEREKFLLENQNLSTVTCQLKNRLMEIETKTHCISAEKERVEAMLRINEKKAVDLEKEREYYNSQTMQLLNSLKEISEQRDLTEAELKDEVMARIGAEKQLQAAERALEHLETALKLTGAQMNELQEHIMPDVHKLREFFEQCAEEAKMEANKPMIMRNAIYARRSVRRSKTLHSRRSFKKKPTGGIEERQIDEMRSDERKIVERSSLMRL